MTGGYGYSFAFGGSTCPGFGGCGKWFLAGLTPGRLSGAIAAYVFIGFQMSFASLMPVLITDGFAGRIKYPAGCSSLASG